MVKRAPRLKTIRRLGTPLPGLTRKEVEATPAVRGARGQVRRRQQKSAYRRRLEEKQKIRFHYGITETQVRRYLAEAVRQRGVTGDVFLSLLEHRLDNVVFRLGLAPTIPAARQAVAHGHVLVDGKRVDRAAYRVEEGERVELSARARSIPAIAEAARQGPEVRLPSYLARNPDDPLVGRVTGTAAREDIPVDVDATSIVEFYAR
jgi:small subunit ribosomal protein S4